jgi:hypothetical protein
MAAQAVHRKTTTPDGQNLHLRVMMLQILEPGSIPCRLDVLSVTENSAPKGYELVISCLLDTRLD